MRFERLVFMLKRLLHRTGRWAAPARAACNPGAPAVAACDETSARRAWLLGGLSAAAAITLQACSSTPARRGSSGRQREVDEPDDGEVGAAGPGSEIVMQALANVGKPYRWGGSRPAEGFDCSGLVAHVFDDALGMKLPRTSLQMSTRGTRIERTGLSAGDLVFFNTSRYAYSHVGIYIGRGRFVHAPSSGSLVRVERMSNPYWSGRFNGARRLVAASPT
jgi:cell wall-associated NlpC family hydrolase